MLHIGARVIVYRCVLFTVFILNIKYSSDVSYHIRGTTRIRRDYNWQHVQTKILSNLLQVLTILTIHDSCTKPLEVYRACIEEESWFKDQPFCD